MCNRLDRSIDRVSAIAVKTGPIDATIKALKYPPAVPGWATIFGRLVVGFLTSHRQPGDYDLITANPTYVGEGSTRTIRHTEMVIDAAAKEDLFDIWPWDVASPRAIVKSGPTSTSAAGRYPQKVAAADELLAVLDIPDPSRVQRKRILVYDDVCTTALQLDRVARVLKSKGALSVEGLVLARQPWRG